MVEVEREREKNKIERGPLTSQEEQQTLYDNTQI